MKKILELFDNMINEGADYWKGTDKNPPGKQLVGDSIIKELETTKTEKSAEWELEEEYANFDEDFDYDAHNAMADRASQNQFDPYNSSADKIKAWAAQAKPKTVKENINKTHSVLQESSYNLVLPSGKVIGKSYKTGDEALAAYKAIQAKYPQHADQLLKNVKIVEKPEFKIVTKTGVQVGGVHPSRDAALAYWKRIPEKHKPGLKIVPDTQQAVTELNDNVTEDNIGTNPKRPVRKGTRVRKVDERVISEERESYLSDVEMIRNELLSVMRGEKQPELFWKHLATWRKTVGDVYSTDVFRAARDMIKSNQSTLAEEQYSNTDDVAGDMQNRMDPELLRLRNKARAHYPQYNRDDATLKLLQRSIQHSEEDDTKVKGEVSSIEKKLARVEKRVEKLEQPAVNVQEDSNISKQSSNFTVDDIKSLETMSDVAQIKAKAKQLISTPSLKPMKPEKVQWFNRAIDSKTNKLGIIKLMYDLLLSGEGMGVVGSKNSMSANSYRTKFNEETSEDPNWDLGGPVEAKGTRGLNATPWQKTFKNVRAMNAWAEKYDATIDGTREADAGYTREKKAASRLGEATNTSGDAVVTYTNRDYKGVSKTFKNDPQGAPENAMKKARAYAAKLEKSKGDDIRSISVKWASELNEDEFYPAKDDGGRSVKSKPWTEDQLHYLQNGLNDSNLVPNSYIKNLYYHTGENRYSAMMKPYDASAKPSYIEINFDVDTGGGGPYPIDIQREKLYGGDATYLGGFDDQENFIAEAKYAGFKILNRESGKSTTYPYKKGWSTKDSEDAALRDQMEVTGLPRGNFAVHEFVKTMNEAGNNPLELQIGMGDSRTPKELKAQIRDLSPDTLEKWSKDKPGKLHSKVAKMQGKLVKSELRRRGLGEAGDGNHSFKYEILPTKENGQFAFNGSMVDFTGSAMNRAITALNQTKRPVKVNAKSYDPALGKFVVVKSVTIEPGENVKSKILSLSDNNAPIAEAKGSSSAERKANRELNQRINSKGVVPSIDRERYTDMSGEGLEGPFRNKQSGEILYYDPKVGKYYNRDSDMYVDHGLDESQDELTMSDQMWGRGEDIATYLYAIHQGEPITKKEIVQLWKENPPSLGTRMFLKPDVPDILAWYNKISREGGALNEGGQSTKFAVGDSVLVKNYQGVGKIHSIISQSEVRVILPNNVRAKVNMADLHPTNSPFSLDSSFNESDCGLSKDEETNFHKKLDTLVHSTFGKREDELNESDEGIDEVLTLLRQGWDVIRQSNAYSDDSKRTIQSIYALLRGALMKGDVADFWQRWEYASGQYPDAFEALAEESGIHSYDDIAQKLGEDELNEASDPDAHERIPQQDPSDLYKARQQAQADDKSAELYSQTIYYVYDGVQHKQVSPRFDSREDAIEARKGIALNNAHLSIQSSKVKPTVNEDAALSSSDWPTEFISMIYSNAYIKHDTQPVAMTKKPTKQDLENNVIVIIGKDGNYYGVRRRRQEGYILYGYIDGKIVGPSYTSSMKDVNAFIKPGKYFAIAINERGYYYSRDEQKYEMNQTRAGRKYIAILKQMNSTFTPRLKQKVEAYVENIYANLRKLNNKSDGSSFRRRDPSDQEAAIAIAGALEDLVKSGFTSKTVESYLQANKKLDHGWGSHYTNISSFVELMGQPLAQAKFAKMILVQANDLHNKVKDMLYKPTVDALTNESIDTKDYSSSWFVYNKETQKPFKGFNSKDEAYEYLIDKMMFDANYTVLHKTEVAHGYPPKTPIVADEAIDPPSSQAPTAGVQPASASGTIKPIAPGAQSTPADTANAAKLAQAAVAGAATMKSAVNATAPTDALEKSLDAASQGIGTNAKDMQNLKPMLDVLNNASKDPKLANQFKQFAGQVNQATK